MKIDKNLSQYVWLMVAIILVVIVGLRYATGTNAEAKKEEKKEAQELKKIAEAPAGNEKSFEAKLSAQQQAVLEEERKKGLLPLLPASGVVPSTNPPINAFEQQIQAQALAQQEANRVKNEAAQLAKVEQEKRVLQINASKIAAWEEGSGQSLLGQNGVGNALATLLNSANPGAGQAAVLESALSAKNALSQPNDNAQAIALASLLGSPNVGKTPSVNQRSVDSASQQWLESQNQANTVLPLTASAPLSPYTLLQGSIIPAVLISSVNSELPGDIKAMVSHDVYDSISQRYVVIPKGSLLIGAYNSEVSNGQERLLFGFNRLILPNGSSVWLQDNQGRGNFKGSDRLGQSGLQAQVNSQFWKIFGSSLLIGTITNFTKPLSEWLFPTAKANKTSGDSSSTTTTVKKINPTTGEETTTVTTSNNSNSTGGTNSSTNLNVSLGNAASDTATSALNDTARRILDRNQNIKPTLTLEKGEKFNLAVARDMLLPPQQASAMVLRSN